MDKLETDFLNTQEYLPLVLYRYIDDLFFISTHGEEKLKFFLNDLNKYHPNINFNHESNSLLDNKLPTYLCIKPRERDQYLHYSSSHSDHTKKSIIYSQTLRLNKICSVEADFMQHKKEMKTWFLKRRYSENIINREMEKVKFEKQLFNSRRVVTKGVPLVIMYHPLLKSVGTMWNKHLHLLRMDIEVKKFVPVARIVSFKSAHKRSSYLVGAKIIH